MRLRAVKPTRRLLIVLLLPLVTLVLGALLLLPDRIQIKASANSGGVVISQCNSCHRNLEAFKTPGLIFRHDVHFQNGIKCAACHTEFPHTPRGTLRVKMETCYACHGLRHSAQGLMAPENCELCHSAGFNLVPSTHTTQFTTALHKEDALRDRLYCRMCHTEEWCSACHDSRKAIPKDHRAKQTWQKGHGKGDKDFSACRVCHQTASLSCDNCHRTPIPHAVFWVGQHAERAKVENESCKMCHQETKYCDNCHHGQLPSNVLVQQNCVKCHTDYKLPLLLVRGRTHMVHKAHLELTNSEPLLCDNCHKFTKVKATGLQYYAFCYECHGKYRSGKLIAKWPGAELCYRCHQTGGGVPSSGLEIPRIPFPAPLPSMKTGGSK